MGGGSNFPKYQQIIDTCPNRVDCCHLFINFFRPIFTSLVYLFYPCAQPRRVCTCGFFCAPAARCHTRQAAGFMFMIAKRFYYQFN
jgi:hypothetical protein